MVATMISCGFREQNLHLVRVEAGREVAVKIVEPQQHPAPPEHLRKVTDAFGGHRTDEAILGESWHPRDNLCGQPRLADSGLTDQQDHPWRVHVGERGIERGLDTVRFWTADKGKVGLIVGC